MELETEATTEEESDESEEEGRSPKRRRTSGGYAATSPLPSPSRILGGDTMQERSQESRQRSREGRGCSQESRQRSREGRGRSQESRRRSRRHSQEDVTESTKLAWSQ